MKPPEGFEQLKSKRKALVCLKKKSLYGVMQSVWNWFLIFTN